MILKTITEHGEAIADIIAYADVEGATDGKPSVYCLRLRSGLFGLECGASLFFETFAELYDFARHSLDLPMSLTKEEEAAPFGMDCGALLEEYRRMIEEGLDDVCGFRAADMLASEFDKWLRAADTMAFVIMRDAAVLEEGR